MEILLIEDNPADANLIMDLCKLKFKDYNIRWFSSLSDGMSQLQLNDFNLIILDLDLPDSNGLNTFFSVKSLTNSPIVILTGHEDKDLGVKAVKEGAQDYLTKGIDAETLCRCLIYAIERHARDITKSPFRKSKKQFTQAIEHMAKIVNTLNNTTASDH